MKNTPDPRLEKLGTDIRAARDAAGLTQRQLSERSGLTQAQISRIENGLVDLQISTLVELARFLGLELILAPRQATPAIQAIARDTKAAIVPPRIKEDLDSLGEVAKQISRFAAVPALPPNLQTQAHETATRLNEALQGISGMASALQTKFASNEFRRTIEHIKSAQRTIASPEFQEQVAQSKTALTRISNALQTVSEGARAIRALRNQIAHTLPDTQRPAFQLDMSED